jgi:hypothetical protein
MTSFKVMLGAAALSAFTLSTGALAQTKSHAVSKAKKPVATSAGFKKTAHGLEYKIVVDTKGLRKPVVGD